jgi:hypothetical protein
MSATFTASDWLRRAAEFWAEADAADYTKHLKITLARGCERIAHHVAAQMEAQLMPEANAGHPKSSRPESLLRGLVALLTTPFLLLTVLVIGCWLQASGKLPAQRRMVLGTVGIALAGGIGAIYLALWIDTGLFHAHRAYNVMLREPNGTTRLLKTWRTEEAAISHLKTLRERLERASRLSHPGEKDWRG